MEKRWWFVLIVISALFSYLIEHAYVFKLMNTHYYKNFHPYYIYLMTFAFLLWAIFSWIEVIKNFKPDHAFMLLLVPLLLSFLVFYWKDVLGSGHLV